MKSAQSLSLIGRNAESAMLGTALERSAAGEFGAVLLSGEAGVGKSRLIQEFLHDAESSGARTLLGNCVPLSSGTLPFGPFVEILRQARRWNEAESLEILDQLATELDDSSPAGSATNRAVPASFARTRPFGLALRLLEALSRGAPLVLVIEDAHWADASSMDLIRYLHATLGDEPVLLIVTFRTDELSSRDPHLEQLAELGRNRRTQRLHLGPLDRNEISQLIENITGGPPAAAVADRIYRQSDGNAFFAEELVAAGPDAGPGLDARIRDVMMSRLSTLSPAARQVLQVAAAVGRSVDHDLLAAVWADGDGLLAAIREAVEGHVLSVDTSGDTYIFRHALMRDAVYQSMLVGERRRLHARIAGCLADNPSLASGQTMSAAAELAHHWNAAGNWLQALDSSMVAARAFARSHAYAESYEQFRRVLAVWGLVRDPASIRVERLELLTEAAEAARLAGDSAAGIALLREALADVDREQRPMLAASLLERLGRCLWEDGHTDQAAEIHQQGNALLAALPDSVLRARLLAAEGRMLMVLARFGESLVVSRTAVTMAHTLKASAVELDATITFGVDLVMTGDADGGLDVLRRTCLMAAAGGEVEDIVRAHGNLSAALGRLSRFEESVQVGDSGLAELRKRGLPLSVGGLLVTNISESLLALGHWDDVLRRITDALQTGLPAVHASFLYRILGELRTARGEFELAGVALARAGEFAVELREPQFLAPLEVAVANLAAERGDRSAARLALTSALAASSGTGQEDVAIQACAAGLQIESDEAADRRAGRDSDVGSMVAAGQRLWELANERAEAAKTSGVSLPDCDAALAWCAASWARLQDRSDDELWSRAAAAWRARNKPYSMATALWRQAEVLMSRQQRVAAKPLLEEALVIARRLGAAPLCDRIGELAQRGRVELSGIDPRTLPQPALAPGTPVLTRRELDVLDCLIEGQTNREIAAKLFISLKTVDKHVSNLMDKLQVRNRVEAAAVGQRLALPQQRSGRVGTTGPADVSSRGRNHSGR